MPLILQFIFYLLYIFYEPIVFEKKPKHLFHFSANQVLKKASNNILSNLPLTVRCHQRSVMMDYVPTLREICKSEKLRELAKVKRR